MGRRAKKAPVQTKKRPTLAKRFKCPFCANEEVVECHMDFRKGIGSLSCRLCGASYQMPIHHLHEPVDVFSEWLDDCEAAAQGKSTNNTNAAVQAATQELPQYDENSSDDEAPPVIENPLAPKNNAAGQKAQAGTTGANGRPSYTDLGLDDSDDDSD